MPSDHGMKLKKLTLYKEVLNFVLDDGSVYIIIKSKEGKFVCAGELYQAELKNEKTELDN